jgi:predicted ArsR family transcriptional regulator
MSEYSALDLRRALRYMEPYRAPLSGREIWEIARDLSIGVEKARGIMVDLLDQGFVQRRRSWSSPHRYWLTERGMQEIQNLRKGAA